MHQLFIIATQRKFSYKKFFAVDQCIVYSLNPEGKTCHIVVNTFIYIYITLDYNKVSNPFGNHRACAIFCKTFKLILLQ